MKSFYTALLFLFIATANVSYAQQSVDRVKFFSDTSIVNATLSMNMGKILSKKDKVGLIFPATFSCMLNDSMKINDQISVEVRGHFRRAYCYTPPLKLIFKNNKQAAFYHIKDSKLVNSCMPTNEFEQYLLKEFVCYKLYNLITDKSFRVRLLNLTYKDSSGKKKAFTGHAFMMEDIKELAKRNDFTVWKTGRVVQEKTNRRQMTLVALFEYLIGNTDWSVPVDHNIKLIRPDNDSTSRAYVVAYDFDGSGMVNTGYIVPDERMGIESVRDRAYRGFPRSVEELNEALDVFRKQKANMYALINNFNLLTGRTKKDMTSYLDEFFAEIDRPAFVKTTFITRARFQ